MYKELPKNSTYNFLKKKLFSPNFFHSLVESKTRTVSLFQGGNGHSFVHHLNPLTDEGHHQIIIGSFTIFMITVTSGRMVGWPLSL